MKLHDYCIKFSEVAYKEESTYHVTSNIGGPFSQAHQDEVAALEVTREEYTALVWLFWDKLPYDWDGKHIWGIELIKI